MESAPTRDLIGYGNRPPRANWPGGARLALNIVVNYEEGAEYCVLNGDSRPETALSDLSGLEPVPGTRILNIESVYEYGSRIGFWRVLKTIQERGLPFTVNAVGLALEQNPPAVETIARLTGERPLGWYTGRPSLNTRRLVVEEGGFLYDSDCYNDELPHWIAEHPYLPA